MRSSLFFPAFCPAFMPHIFHRLRGAPCFSAGLELSAFLLHDVREFIEIKIREGLKKFERGHGIDTDVQRLIPRTGLYPIAPRPAFINFRYDGLGRELPEIFFIISI